MELVDSITVRHNQRDRQLMLFVGSISALPESERVDVLVVSAFPDDYRPTHRSLIGALDLAGLSVGELARDKEVDLRKFSNCWLSRPIDRADVQFQRILCFEPGYTNQRPAEVVGDIFRSIVPFTAGNPPISSIAMPLLATGAQRETPERMVEALAEAAVEWLKVGLPLDRIKIVVRQSVDRQEIRDAFARVREKHSDTGPRIAKPEFRFDLFISYSHQNIEPAGLLMNELQHRRPDLRVFLDRMELKPGFAWQEHIFESLEHSRKVVCLLSPAYLASKVCKEEYNMAHFRHRESSEGVLLPIYLHTAELPLYMKLTQYEDVREADRTKIESLAARLASQL